jgi:glycosyltransferase A (GT-A) superfamily protein (DUF2064 family)
VPTFDGGFASITTRKRLPDLKGEIPWSKPHTLAATIERLKSAKTLSALTSFWYDVDQAEDVAFLARHLLSAMDESVATETRAWIARKGFDALGRRSGS